MYTDIAFCNLNIQYWKGIISFFSILVHSKCVSANILSSKVLCFVNTVKMSSLCIFSISTTSILQGCTLINDKRSKT